MDRGLILAIFSIISGWALILLSLLVIKVLILSTREGSFVYSLIEVGMGFLTLISFLFIWYRLLRYLFLRTKVGDSGPGGT